MPARNGANPPSPRPHGLDRSSAGRRSGLQPLGKDTWQATEGARVLPAGAARGGARLHASRNEAPPVVLKSHATRHAGTDGQTWCIGFNSLGRHEAPAQREKTNKYGYAKRDRLAPLVRWGGRTQPLFGGDQEIPDPQPRGRIYARQALARAWRHGGRRQTSQFAPAAR